MKVLTLIFLLLLLTTGIVAQSSSSQNPPGIVVNGTKWRREFRSPMLDDDPLRASEQQAQLQRAIIETLRTNAAIIRLGSRDIRQLPVPTVGVAPRNTSGSFSDDYVYRFRLGNSGAKRIVKVVWDYVFIDPATKTEAGRHRFMNKTNIRAGKSRNLFGRSQSPPVRVVDANMAGRSAKEQYAEEVVILSIKYDDGSTWTR
jgi:hypothetical protein